jgi:hypothetical protein
LFSRKVLRDFLISKSREHQNLSSDKSGADLPSSGNPYSQHNFLLTRDRGILEINGNHQLSLPKLLRVTNLVVYVKDFSFHVCNPFQTFSNDQSLAFNCFINSSTVFERIPKPSSSSFIAAKKAITKFAKEISARFCYNLTITGHTSSKEAASGKKTTKKQKALSVARTNAVTTYFNDVIRGLGKTTPLNIVKESKGATTRLNKDKTKAQQAANRRVAFLVTSGG